MDLESSFPTTRRVGRGNEDKLKAICVGISVQVRCSCANKVDVKVKNGSRQAVFFFSFAKETVKKEASCLLKTCSDVSFISTFTWCPANQASVHLRHAKTSLFRMDPELE